jgi:DNA adenine methylase
VYLDPPYQPISSTANFTSYTHRDFTEDDLQRLADLANQLSSKGCHVLLSNSNSKTVKNHFSGEHWSISKINANRAINSNPAKRTGHKEIIIKNY